MTTDFRKYHQKCATAETTTPLQMAVFMGHEKVVQALLTAKADDTSAFQVQQAAQAPSSYDDTRLHTRVSHTFHS